MGDRREGVASPGSPATRSERSRRRAPGNARGRDGARDSNPGSALAVAASSPSAFASAARGSESARLAERSFRTSRTTRRSPAPGSMRSVTSATSSSASKPARTGSGVTPPLRRGPTTLPRSRTTTHPGRAARGRPRLVQRPLPRAPLCAGPPEPTTPRAGAPLRLPSRTRSRMHPMDRRLSREGVHRPAGIRSDLVSTMQCGLRASSSE